MLESIIYISVLVGVDVCVERFWKEEVSADLKVQVCLLKDIEQEAGEDERECSEEEEGWRVAVALVDNVSYHGDYT